VTNRDVLIASKPFWYAQIGFVSLTGGSKYPGSSWIYGIVNPLLEGFTMSRYAARSKSKPSFFKEEKDQ